MLNICDEHYLPLPCNDPLEWVLEPETTSEEELEQIMSLNDAPMPKKDRPRVRLAERLKRTLA